MGLSPLAASEWIETGDDCLAQMAEKRRLLRDKREQVLAMIRADPHRCVGQQVLNLSSAPTSDHDRLVRGNVVLRNFERANRGS